MKLKSIKSSCFLGSSSGWADDLWNHTGQIVRIRHLSLSPISVPPWVPLEASNRLLQALDRLLEAICRPLRSETGFQRLQGGFRNFSGLRLSEASDRLSQASDWQKKCVHSLLQGIGCPGKKHYSVPKKHFTWLIEHFIFEYSTTSKTIFCKFLWDTNIFMGHLISKPTLSESL